MRRKLRLACLLVVAGNIANAAPGRLLQSRSALEGASAPALAEGIATSGAGGPSQPEEVPDFAGKPLTKLPSRKKAISGDVPFPVNDADQLADLTEKQLWTIFARGVADNPSTLPGETGQSPPCIVVIAEDEPKQFLNHAATVTYEGHVLTQGSLLCARMMC